LEFITWRTHVHPIKGLDQLKIRPNWRNYGIESECNMSQTEAQKKDVAETLRVNEKKWTKELMDQGWNVIPNIIIEKQEALGLDAIDMNIVLHLSHYWWHRENLPHPSVATIAKAIGIKPRTVQKRMKGLEDLGFVKRVMRNAKHGGNETNEYDLSGLIEKAKPFAEEKKQLRAAREAEEKARLARKRPKLAVVK
ncbi:MAG TPA: helix-turn-helix domain-containing protein, partial [Ensifer sp.]|nr:helix-turn-helix domain-containing protein [Ensifer sp.]